MKDYYKIGEIAKLYNISPDSLRYYEDLDILKPHRGENNYRIYHIHDLWRLNVIRDLRELGFSMERIKEYLSNRSIASTEELLKEELQIIDTRIHSLAELRINIEDRLSTLKEAQEQPIGVIARKQFPERRCHTIYSRYQADEEMDMLIKQLLNKNKDKLYIIGNNRIGSVLPLAHAQNGRYRSYTGVFIIDKDGDSHIPEGSYLTLTYQGNCAQNADYIPLMLKYAHEHGLTLEDPFLELLWTDIHQSEAEQEHRTELQILCR